MAPNPLRPVPRSRFNSTVSHLVVGVVGRGQIAVLGAEKRIAQMPGGLLQALAGLGGPLPDVAPAHSQGNGPDAAEGADKGFVAVGLRAPEAVVEMGRREREVQLPLQSGQTVEQRHGIGTRRIRRRPPGSPAAGSAGPPEPQGPSCFHSRSEKVVNWGSHWSLTVPVSPWRFLATMISATFFSGVSG